jgi:hypothetical protein
MKFQKANIPSTGGAKEGSIGSDEVYYHGKETNLSHGF